jgi:uncharacterized membrane protein
MQRSQTSSAMAPEGRRRVLLSASLALCVAGVAIAIYLTWVHYNENVLVCTTGGCETVQKSEYSTIGNVPIATLGIGMFLSIGALSVLRLTGSKLLAFDTATLIAWVIVLTGIMYYVYLSYVELFVINAICQWCVGSSVITLSILVVESIQVWNVLDLGGGDDDPVEPVRRSPSRR